MATKLTMKQQKFIESYLICFNATRAAREAGYKGNGKTLAVVGSENLRKPYIAEEIKVRLQSSAMSADELLMRLGEQSRPDYADYITSEGIDLDTLLKDGKGYLIKSMKPGKYGYIIEFHNPLDSQQLIGRHLKLFTDRIEQDTTIDFQSDAIDKLSGLLAGYQSAETNDTGEADK